MLVLLAIILFFASLGVLLFELVLTRIFSIVLWYDYAFMAISIAFFGLGIGSFLVHMQKDKIRGQSEEEKQQLLLTKILESAIAFAISVPVFIFVIGHAIPSDTSYIYLYYLAASVPFFFAGVVIALIFLAIPKEISKLYFADLAGAASATLLLDPLIQRLGAESVLLTISLLVVGPSVAAILVSSGIIKRQYIFFPIASKIKLFSSATIAAIIFLLILNTLNPAILAIQPGITKGLHQRLEDQSVEHLSTQWNSFSRIDVTRPNYDVGSLSEGPVELATIIIDADAVTPVLRWNGSYSDTVWIRNYMDYLPYQMLRVNNTLVIGGGGGEDVLVAFAGGAKKVTAVEINPLIVSATKQFGNLSGNIYSRDDVDVFIDDGRRFISSSNSKYDVITIKLVDSWAAQLAGGYALTENYLYTVEAFREYLEHLNGENGMLAMVRWNTELPRLLPLVIESLKQHTGNSAQEVSRQIVAIEDRPGLYFGSNPEQTLYPVLVIVKNSPFTDGQIELVKSAAERNDAEIIVLSDRHIEPPYDKLLMPSDPNNNSDQSSQQFQSRRNDDNSNNLTGATIASSSTLALEPPTDDSPFYFAKELVPKQMITLLVTVFAISAVLCLLLVAFARRNRISLNSTSWFHISFVVFIGLGFMLLEITFIQKFLLLLGTPIMALTVILFSILLSTGIGSYVSGKIFCKKPQRAVLFSIPILLGIILAYYGFLDHIIAANMAMQPYERIALTFALLSPAGILMGFQFPSIIRMSSISFRASNDTTLLWGVNVIASVIGTVLAATLAMIIGLSGNLLIGLGLYIGALLSVILAVAKTIKHTGIIKSRF